MNVAQPRYRAFYAEEIPGRQPKPTRAYALACLSGLFLTGGAAVMLLVGVLTAFRARRLYSRCATAISRAVLRIYGIRLRVHRAGPWPARQAVYVSNHTSTLDLFVLVALGLPNTRFFLSGFLRRIAPLGVISWLMGTFFTVPQSRPAERSRIFQAAEATLRRTGESVYLSPEGERITTGEIGHFNKGAFHLATNLGAPIVPMFIRIPATVDPRKGFDARPGVIDVHVLPPVDTAGWTLDQLIENKESIRHIFVHFQEERAWA
jgi:1-acyl-sn-glycerol-3-phosphate acyltransferase